MAEEVSNRLFKPFSPQTQSSCPEDPHIKRALCASDADCHPGRYLVFGHGPFTGRCVMSDRPHSHPNVTVCEIYAWQVCLHFWGPGEK